MSPPLVSIGITSYNRPKTLERTLQSVVAQTYHNLEIIVSDDSSTNPDVELVLFKFIDDKRVKYIRQPVNLGMTYNQNVVLNLASGDFFMRLADDDWLEKNYIESCVKFLIENPEYSSAYGCAKLFNEKGEFLTDDANVDLVQESGLERTKLYLSSVMLNGTSYGLVRRKHWGEILISNTIGADWLPILRLAYLGKYKLLSCTTSYLSAGGASSSLTGLTQLLNLTAFGKSFPYLTVGSNVVRDIIWGSDVYKNMGINKRIHFAAECFRIIFTRHKVRRELKLGLKNLIQLKQNELRSLTGRIRRTIHI